MLPAVNCKFHERHRSDHANLVSGRYRHAPSALMHHKLIIAMIGMPLSFGNGCAWNCQMWVAVLKCFCYRHSLPATNAKMTQNDAAVLKRVWKPREALFVEKKVHVGKSPHILPPLVGVILINSELYGDSSSYSLSITN